MEDITRVVEPDSPDRCQGMTKFGQCNCKKIPGKNFCKMHAGFGNAQQDVARNYRLTKWQAQLERMGDNPSLKSLRDELAILRMLMEERLNLCKDSHDLILQSHVISDLATKIERLVLSCSKLDFQLGKMLDKSALVNFANEIISIIGEEVKDPAAIDSIATKIINTIEVNNVREN
jgi:hypothetical protein